MAETQLERDARYREVKQHEVKEKAKTLQDFIRHKFNLTLDLDDLEFYMEHFFKYEWQLVSQERGHVKSYDEIVQKLSKEICINTERSVICAKKFLEAIGANILLVENIILVETQLAKSVISIDATLGQDYLLCVNCFVTWDRSRIVPEFTIEYRLTNNRLWNSGAISSMTDVKINVDDLQKDFETLFRKHKDLLLDPFDAGYRSN